MNTKEFCEGHKNIEMQAIKVFSNPHGGEWSKAANHYQCKITVRGKGPERMMIVYFSKGSGLRGHPNVCEVLDCLASDASFAADTFENFCSDLGYNTDSIKDLETYNTIQKQTKELRTLLGNDLYFELIECERT